MFLLRLRLQQRSITCVAEQHEVRLPLSCCAKRASVMTVCEVRAGGIGVRHDAT